MTDNGTRTEPELVRFSLRIREDYLTQIERKAIEADRSVNWMLNHLVGQALEKK